MANCSTFSRHVVASLKPIGHLESKNNASNMIYLRNNENPFGGVHHRYPGYSDDHVHDLPDAYLRFLLSLDREKLPHETQSQLNAFSASSILLTHGAANGLEQIIKAFLEPSKDSIIITPPCFSVYLRLAAIFHLNVQMSPLLGDDYDRLDLEMICHSSAKAIVLCDPNNPIGSRLQPDEIRYLVTHFTGLIIIDEAYVEYSHLPSNLAFAVNAPNVLILRTMSKALGMAGLRIGAVMGHPDLIESIRRVQLPFSICSSAALLAFQELSQKTRLIAQIESFQQERKRLFISLSTLPIIQSIWGKDSGFITIAVKDLTCVQKQLQSAGIEPVYQPEGLASCIRLSIGAPSENDKLIDALNKIEWRHD